MLISLTRWDASYDIVRHSKLAVLLHGGTGKNVHRWWNCLRWNHLQWLQHIPIKDIQIKDICPSNRKVSWWNSYISVFVISFYICCLLNLVIVSELWNFIVTSTNNILFIIILDFQFYCYNILCIPKKYTDNVYLMIE